MDIDARIATERFFEERWGELGYEALLPEEREHLGVFWVSGEISNGGLHQFFWNSSGEMAFEAITGLEAVGASEAANVIRQAVAIFGEGKYPRDTVSRRAALEDVWPYPDDHRELEDAWYAVEKDWTTMSLQRLRRIYLDRGLLPS